MMSNFVCLNVQAKESFASNVIGITEQQLSPNYWLKKLISPAANQILMSPLEIQQQNQTLIRDNAYISAPLTFTDSLSKQQLVSLIDNISKVPSDERFYHDGTKLVTQNYQHYVDNLNKKAIVVTNKVKFGLVIRRSSLRTFPTLDKVYEKDSDHDLDRFQESAVFPGDALAVLHSSRDGHWLLVKAYNYIAWILKTDVAIGSKAMVKAYQNTEHFLVVTGSKIFTTYVPEQANISELQLDMGTRLPLAKRSDYGNEIYGQNPFASYVIKLPTRSITGQLNIVLALIPRAQDVHLGYLAFNQQNIIKQAFKFLGERYGWGHDFNGRDCTGFIDEVYKTFGFNLPRNSGQQGHSAFGLNIRFEKNTKIADKLRVLNKTEVGDLIYIPGHVMMVLGEDQGKPYIIHDVKGLGYLKANGGFYQGTLNGVSVTPLLPLQISATESYVEQIYNIKRIKFND